VEEKEIPHNLDRVLGVEGEGNVLTPNHALTINSSQMIGGLVIGHKRHQHGGENPNGARSLTCSTQRRTGGEGEGPSIEFYRRDVSRAGMPTIGHRLLQCSDASRVARTMVSACRRRLEG
jgi:hypothetical protein